MGHVCYEGFFHVGVFCHLSCLDEFLLARFELVYLDDDAVRLDKFSIFVEDGFAAYLVPVVFVLSVKVGLEFFGERYSVARH